MLYSEEINRLSSQRLTVKWKIETSPVCFKEPLQDDKTFAQYVCRSRTEVVSAASTSPNLEQVWSTYCGEWDGCGLAAAMPGFVLGLD